MGRQGDFLERLERGPTLTPAVRQPVIPLLAALLLEVVTNLAADMADRAAREKGAGDEQDRA